MSKCCYQCVEKGILLNRILSVHYHNTNNHDPMSNYLLFQFFISTCEQMNDCSICDKNITFYVDKDWNGFGQIYFRNDSKIPTYSPIPKYKLQSFANIMIS